MEETRAIIGSCSIGCGGDAPIWVRCFRFSAGTVA